MFISISTDLLESLKLSGAVGLACFFDIVWLYFYYDKWENGTWIGIEKNGIIRSITIWGTFINIILIRPILIIL